jgi:hypothetical protein
MNLHQLSARLDDLIEFQEAEDFDHAYKNAQLMKRVKQLWKSGELKEGRYDHPEIAAMAELYAVRHQQKRSKPDNA